MEGASGGSLEQTRLEVRQGVPGVISKPQQELVWDKNSRALSSSHSSLSFPLGSKV